MGPPNTGRPIGRPGHNTHCCQGGAAAAHHDMKGVTVEFMDRRGEDPVRTLPRYVSLEDVRLIVPVVRVRREDLPEHGGRHPA